MTALIPGDSFDAVIDYTDGPFALPPEARVVDAEPVRIVQSPGGALIVGTLPIGHPLIGFRDHVTVYDERVLGLVESYPCYRGAVTFDDLDQVPPVFEELLTAAGPKAAAHKDVVGVIEGTDLLIQVEPELKDHALHALQQLGDFTLAASPGLGTGELFHLDDDGQTILLTEDHT